MSDGYTDPFLAGYRPTSDGKQSKAAHAQDLQTLFANYSMKGSDSPMPVIVASLSPFEDSLASAFANLPEQQGYNAGKEFPFPAVSKPKTSTRPTLDTIVPRRAATLTIATPHRASFASQASTPSTPPLTPPSLYSPAESYSSLPTPSSSHSFEFVASPEQEPWEESEQDEEITMSEQLLSRHKLLPDFLEQYEIVSELGTGGFGFVVQGIRKKDQFNVAVKFIFKESMPAQAWVRDLRWNRGSRLIPSEAQMLMSIRHDGVVAFLDLFEDDEYFYLAMEHHGTPWADQREVKSSVKSSPGDYAPETPSKHRSGSTTGTPASLPLPRPAPAIRRSSCDLFECIEQRSKLSENEARYVFAQIVSISYFLQSNDIYHMDLKDENLVVDKKLKVKLIDFGSAVRCAPTRAFSRFYGTVAYASPEILQGLPYHAPASEIWALGILFSVLLMGESIYRNPDAVMVNDYNQEAFNALNPDCQHLLHLCLQYDPSRRASIAELRAHPYLSAAIRAIERPQRRK